MSLTFGIQFKLGIFSNQCWYISVQIRIGILLHANDLFVSSTCEVLYHRFWLLKLACIQYSSKPIKSYSKFWLSSTLPLCSLLWSLKTLTKNLSRKNYWRLQFQKSLILENLICQLSLHKLIGQNSIESSWVKKDVENWKSQENSSNFGDFKDFLKKIACVNDFAEINIKLTQSLL